MRATSTSVDARLSGRLGFTSTEISSRSNSCAVGLFPLPFGSRLCRDSRHPCSRSKQPSSASSERRTREIIVRTIRAMFSARSTYRPSQNTLSATPLGTARPIPVSYTHLDVYKRQATDNGFFYDVYRETPFTEANLAAIEARMAQVVARDEPFLRLHESREAGLVDYTAQGEFMKVHFIEKLTHPGEPISLYRNGSFTDFCRGPHIPSTGRVKAFKITSIAGAYWLGDEHNQQLQRIYGTCLLYTSRCV